MSGDLTIDSIYQVGVGVNDLDAAVDFYRDKLGLKFIAKFPPGLALFDCSGVRLMLSAVPGEQSTGNSVIYFNVRDVQTSYDTLDSRGVEVISEPHIIHSTDNYELWMAFFKDPEGNVLAIADERGELGA